MSRTFSIDKEGNHVVPRTDGLVGVPIQCARDHENHEAHDWLWVSGEVAIDFHCPGVSTALSLKEKQDIARRAHIKWLRVQRKLKKSRQSRGR